MKKIIAIALSVLMLVSLLTACGAEKPADTAKTVKFGAGVQSAITPADATDEKNASGTLDASLAAVLVDADGKIVACQLDAVNMKTEFLADGKVKPVADKDLTSKVEQGDKYNMVNYGKGQAIDGGDVTKEWYQQADILETLVIGKTIAEVKALVVNGYRGNDAVIAAGCTIGINDLVLAVEKAVANAKTEVAADAKLSIGVKGEQKVTEASAEANASNKLTANIFIAAVDAAGKVLASSTDCVENTFTLKDGKVDIDNKDGLSKRNKGDGYNMVAYGKGKAIDGGDVKNEWYVQANAFDAACVGKTASEIAGLMLTEGQHAGRGVEGLQAAGCTIYVSGFVAAAAKI